MRGVMQFNKDRLTQALNARGLTQTTLCALTGYSSGTVSKWVAGTQLPEYSAIEKIATALNVKESWLMKPMIELGQEVNFFRSNVSTTKTVRKMAEVRLEWSYELTSILEEWIDFPKVNFPRLLTRSEWLSLTDGEIEELAKEYRNHWKLGNGPIKNLTKVAEAAGIIIIQQELGYSDMDGVSRWFKTNNRPYIFLVSDKASAVRMRFDLAHEISHLILHQGVKQEEYNSKEMYKEIERQAHLFASALLMPAESIVNELAYPTLDSLLILKRKWLVSVGALIMRAKSLGLIDDVYTDRLWRNYGSRKWRTKEPFDDVIVCEHPTIFKKTVELLLEQGGFSKNILVQKADLSNYDLESICYLPNGYMNDEFGELLHMNKVNLKNSVNTHTNLDNNIIAMPIRNKK